MSEALAGCVINFGEAAGFIYVGWVIVATAGCLMAFHHYHERAKRKQREHRHNGQ